MSPGAVAENPKTIEGFSDSDASNDEGDEVYRNMCQCLSVELPHSVFNVAKIPFYLILTRDSGRDPMILTVKKRQVKAKRCLLVNQVWTHLRLEKL